MILASAIDEAANLKPPPMFSKTLLFMNEFSDKHSGAKSNNLKFLQSRLMAGVRLPDSACIPFQVLEYTLGLFPDTQKKVKALIDQITGVKSVRRMNRMLN